MRLENHPGVDVFRLDAGRANAIGPAFVASMNDLLNEREGRDQPLVITGVKRTFSAGLALPDLFGLSRDEMRTFMTAFDAMMARVFFLPVPVLAAVNGHAIAGGCVLAMMADERLMARGKFKMGLNETALGIGLPTVVLETFRVQTPPAAHREVALHGSLVSPEYAMALGMVHALYDHDALEQAALDRARELGEQVGREGFAQVKAGLRQPVRAALGGERELTDRESWLDSWFSETARVRIGALVDALTTRSGS